jgi:hypothetical protein
MGLLSLWEMDAARVRFGAVHRSGVIGIIERLAGQEEMVFEPLGS